MIATYKFLSQLALKTSLKLSHNATVQMVHRCKHRCGNVFQLGERELKLNDFSVGEAKIGEKQSRRSNSKYNFMQYVFFKKAYAVYNVVWGKAPEAGEFSSILVLKVTLHNLTVCKVQDVLAVPSITLLPRFLCLWIVNNMQWSRVQTKDGSADSREEN